MKKFLRYSGAAIGVLIACIAIGYQFSRHAILARIDEGSKMAETAVGPIQYSIIGESGPYILFAHGTPGGFNHTPFFTPEGIKGYRLLTPSRAGYMGTSLNAGKTPEEQAHAYAALMDALNIHQVSVLGISGGGPSAIAFAALYPERTSSLVGLEILSEASAEPLDIPFAMRNDFVFWCGIELATRLGDGKALLGMFPENEARKILGSPDGLARTREWLWAAWPISSKLQGWRNDSEQFMQLALPIDTIQAPTLILHGTDDQSAPYAAAERLALRIPGARLHTVKGGNHAMILSHKDGLYGEILGFLHSVYGAGETVDTVSE
jgi:pimeloyl-ACP methyl ester carboxylesterase